MPKYINIEDACAEVDRGDLLVGNNAEWAKEIICRTKTANVTEVIHGSWILSVNNMPYRLFVCSVCRNNVEYVYQFCPHCGARMDLPMQEVIIK